MDRKEAIKNEPYALQPDDLLEMYASRHNLTAIVICRIYELSLNGISWLFDYFESYMGIEKFKYGYSSEYFTREDSDRLEYLIIELQDPIKHRPSDIFEEIKTITQASMYLFVNGNKVSEY